MKNLKQLTKISILSILFVLASCSKDSDGGSGSAASGTITGKVNGTTVTSTTQLTTATQVSAGSTSTLIMQGTNNDGKGFQFNINGFDGVGSYEFGGDNIVFVNGSYVEGNALNPLDTQIWSAPYDDTTVRGQITFTNVTSSKVQGTFEFTCKNANDNSVKEITNGSFNVNLTSF